MFPIASLSNHRQKEFWEKRTTNKRKNKVLPVYDINHQT